MNNESFDWNSRDRLFDEVAHYVVERQAVLASAISDKFYIGTNRAKRIIKQLEQAHIVGEEWSSRYPREIYYCCSRKLDERLSDLATIARLQPLEDKWQAEWAEYEAKEREDCREVITPSPQHLRLVMDFTFATDASAVVLARVSRGYLCMPSGSDLAAMRHIHEGLRIIGRTLYDYLIINNSDGVSARQHMLM